MNKKLVWIGRRESDILASKYLFNKSFTQFGRNKESNYSITSEYIQSWDFKKTSVYHEFIKSNIEPLLDRDEYLFMFYNQQDAYHVLDANNINSALGINDISLLNWLNNKTLTRLWASSFINVPEYVLMSNKECDYESLKKMFPSYTQFILQKPISDAGNGTFLLNELNISEIEQKIESIPLLLISPYYKDCIPVNCNIIIQKNNVTVFPHSIQIINKTDMSFSYSGADFITATQMERNIKNKIHNYSLNIGKKLAKSGYLGICGIDYLINNNDVFFQEINPRFQASSFLIDIELNKQYGMSLFQLHADAFNNTKGVAASIYDWERIEIGKNFSQKTLNDISNFEINVSNSSNQFVEPGLSDNKPTEALSVRSLTFDNLYTQSLNTETNYYYDYFSSIYKIMVRDYQHAIQTEGKIIYGLLNKNTSQLHSILDCMCGIGVQANSLSMFNSTLDICGTDISLQELEIAKQESKRLNTTVSFDYSDCKTLDNIPTNTFDAIIAMDNAIPHLLTKDSILQAFKTIYNRLKEDGVFLSSYRDYEKILAEKPTSAYPLRVKKSGNKKYVIIREWEWNENICTSHQYVIKETLNSRKLYYNKYNQIAITKKELLALGICAGFKHTEWILESQSGYYQPILLLKK